MKYLLLSLVILSSVVGAATGAGQGPTSGSASGKLPPGLLLPGYVLLASAEINPVPGRHFWIVAQGRKGDEAANASDRPLLIFEQRGTGFVLAARNDHVVLRADEGGQCDPFTDGIGVGDGDGEIVAKGRYFTVENSVACGQHWSDFITFRFNDRAGFVFDNERFESWSLAPNDSPQAGGLVSDGPQSVTRDRPGHLTAFAAWKSR